MDVVEGAQWVMDSVLGAGSYGIVVSFVCKGDASPGKVAAKFSDISDTFLVEVKVTRLLEEQLRKRGRCPFLLERVRSRIYQMELDIQKHPWNLIWGGAQMSVLDHIQEHWRTFVGTSPRKSARTKEMVVSLRDYCRGSLPKEDYMNIEFKARDGPPLGGLIVELGDGGSSQTCLREGVWATRSDMRCFIGALMAQVGGLHAVGILHRDLHAENVVTKLYSGVDEPSPLFRAGGAALNLVTLMSKYPWHVPTLIDFGAASWPPVAPGAGVELTRPRTILPQRAPELIMYGFPCMGTPASDVWALGVMFLHVCLCVVHGKGPLNAMLDAHRGMQRHTAMPHPFLIPALFDVPPGFIPPVPPPFVQEIIQFPDRIEGGVRRWNALRVAEHGGEGVAIAHLLWFMVHALGMPDTKKIPRLSQSDVYKSLENAVRQRSPMPHKAHPESGWVWRNTKLKKLLGAHGMSLLRAMLSWDPAERPVDLHRVLERHPFFRTNRRSGFFTLRRAKKATARRKRARDDEAVRR